MGTLGTLPTIGPFSTHPRILTFRLILTPSAFLSQKSSLISKHALPQDGVRTSLELLETTMWFSRRSTYQLSAMTWARPPSGPPDSARGSSWTIRLSALAELTARTPAREMVEAPLSARASLTQLPTSRLVSLPGVSAVARTTHLVYASVSKGVCWIDYAMTCQFGQQSGSYSSYWGYSAQQCQTWMDGELSRLNQEVADMQNAGSLTGRKKAAALAKGLKAQETLNKYSQCNVFWQPIDAAPLTTGGNGYVDGGDVDIPTQRPRPSMLPHSQTALIL